MAFMRMMFAPARFEQQEVRWLQRAVTGNPRFDKRWDTHSHPKLAWPVDRLTSYNSTAGGIEAARVKKGKPPARIFTRGLTVFFLDDLWLGPAGPRHHGESVYHTTNESLRRSKNYLAALSVRGSRRTYASGEVR
jgi:hypothetical protein